MWVRPVNKEVEKAPSLEKGIYGTPTLPDGKRPELPQRDEKVDGRPDADSPAVHLRAAERAELQEEAGDANASVNGYVPTICP